MGSGKKVTKLVRNPALTNQIIAFITTKIIFYGDLNLGWNTYIFNYICIYVIICCVRSYRCQSVFSLLFRTIHYVICSIVIHTCFSLCIQIHNNNNIEICVRKRSHNNHQSWIREARPIESIISRHRNKTFSGDEVSRLRYLHEV